MAKSKRFDIKALLLNHGEKLAAMLIVLLGLTGLATANWSPSAKQPDELKATADATRSTWQANPFTEDKRVNFENTRDVLELAERMQSETEDLEKYSTFNQWNPPIHLVRERRGAVTVLSPTDPEAKPIAIVMAEKSELLEEDAELTTDKNLPGDKKAPEVGDDVKNIFGVAGGPGAGVGAAGLGVPGQPLMPSGGFGRKGDEEENDNGGFSANGFGRDAFGGTMTATMERNVRYRSGVSVRMIFPLLEQIRSTAKALHLPQNDPQVAAAIDFVGFQIERKKAVAGKDPGSGEWESISIEEIGEVLEMSLGFDLDVVSSGVTRSEITMPLPRLAAGNWTLADASHKSLDDFKLDEEEQKLVDRFNAKLLEEAERRKKMTPELTKKGGFNRFMLNGSQLNRAVGDTANLTDEMFTEMERDKNDKKDSRQKSRYDDRKELEKLINRSMATGRVLLVRFMDFTCDRGNAYTYRVRLEMKNPNFNFPVDQLEQPDLATQATIFSEWSAQTVPAYVPQSYRYYTQRADNPQSVKVGMFYENEKAGTPVMANIEVRVGSRIGGKQKVEVVNLSKSVLESEDVELKSPDLLAAISPSIRLNGSDSPELKAYVDSMRGQGKPLADRMTVVDNNGAIVTRYVGDSVANGGFSKTESLDSKYYQDILKVYESWKNGGNATAGIYGIDDKDLRSGQLSGMSDGNSLSGGGKGARRNKKD